MNATLLCQFYLLCFGPKFYFNWCISSTYIISLLSYFGCIAVWCRFYSIVSYYLASDVKVRRHIKKRVKHTSRVIYGKAHIIQTSFWHLLKHFAKYPMQWREYYDSQWLKSIDCPHKSTKNTFPQASLSGNYFCAFTWAGSILDVTHHSWGIPIVWKFRNRNLTYRIGTILAPDTCRKWIYASWMNPISSSNNCEVVNTSCESTAVRTIINRLFWDYGS